MFCFLLGCYGDIFLTASAAHKMIIVIFLLQKLLLLLLGLEMLLSVKKLDHPINVGL